MRFESRRFRAILRVEETSAVGLDETGYRTRAPGVGLIRDEDLLPTEYREGR